MNDPRPTMRLSTGIVEVDVPSSPRGAVVGRGATASVRLTGDGVSREHARIGHDGDRWWIEDVPSSSPTLLDGRVLSDRAPLRDGARIGLGATLTVTAVTDERDSQPAPTAAAPSASTGRPVPLTTDRAITIGREPDNDIVVDDLLVSRHHAEVRPTPSGHVLQDLGSSNGSYVNGHRVTVAEVNEGDRISIGHTHLTVAAGTLVPSRPSLGASFAAENLTVRVGKGKVLLDNVSFHLPPGRLVAVIGPSGAGKSTFLGALTGSRDASEGRVLYGDRDLHRNYDELKQRVGIVPQDDIVHRELTVEAALRYSAELRFPHDVSRAERAQAVERAMHSLDLYEHRRKRIHQLSGGQRKRVSVAMELLTEPSLLFLDEPTSGLDPGMDRKLMSNLRALAKGEGPDGSDVDTARTEAARTVMVITHSTDNLNLADRVMALAPGGVLAYDGPPDELLRHFGADSYADVFTALQEGQYTPASPAPVTSQPDQAEAVQPPHSEAPRQQSALRQFSTVARRQLRVMSADRGFLALTLFMPVALGLLTWLVPGDGIFEPQPATAEPSSSPLQVVMILAIGAAFIGLSSTIRAVVAERPIFAREHAVGLRSGSYVAAKLLLATLVAVVQCAIMVAVSLARVGTPTHHIIAPSAVELSLAMGVCAAACTALGMAVSSVTRSTEQVMPSLVVSIMIMLVLSGGLFPLNGRAGLEQVSWLSPTRWGFAMGASSVDVRNLTATAAPDPLWSHGLDLYGFSALACLALYVVLAGSAWVLVERTAARR